VGTRTRMNIGKYVFEQTVKHAKTNTVKFPITFPIMLSNIMMEQHPSLLTIADTPKKRESALTLHCKLFGDDHVSDIVGTSRRVLGAGAMTKEQIIVALKDTCVMLDERKAQFELMIQSLEIEDAAAEDEPEEDEGGDIDGAVNEDESDEEDSGNSSEEAE